MTIPPGYTQNKFKGLTMLVDSRLAGGCPDDCWQKICTELFSSDDAALVFKQGAYKTIMKVQVEGVPCIVKKYRSRGGPALLRRSKARREFEAAVYVHGRGIPTAAPLLLAEAAGAGRPRESLVALPLIARAEELRDVFFGTGFSPGEKRRIAFDFGKLTARIFSAGVFQNDYSLNNFLVTRKDGRLPIHFIDFERVKIKKSLAAEERHLLLSKLNRVGCEVSLANRLRFLSGYLAQDSTAAPNVSELARALQRRTIRLLQQDARRGRLTSLYTHGRYVRISRGGWTGLCRRGYDPGEAVRQVCGIPPAQPRAEVTLDFEGREPMRLQAVQFENREASAVWAALSTLIVAGARLELPPVLLEDQQRGFVLLPPDGAALEALAGGRSRAARFIQTHLKGELEKALQLVRKTQPVFKGFGS